MENEKDKDNGLPNGWVKCSLTDFCFLNMGQSPDSSTYNDKGEGLPFYQGKTEFGELYPTPVKYCNKPNKIGDIGDVLLSVRAPVGPTNLLNHTACIGRGLSAIKPSGGISSKFVLFILRSVQNELSNAGTGTTFKAITKDFLCTLKFPLPPLAEQHRIVAKLEELFSELDKGVETLRAAQQQLKVYRQAVLQWAFEGKLTEEWRKKQTQWNSANESIARDIPGNWSWVKMESVAKKITDGEHFKPQTQENGIYFLSAKDVCEKSISFSDPLYISLETAQKAWSRCKPERGDLLIVSRGATIGRLCIVNTDKEFCLLGSVILIKINSLINNKWLLYALKSPGIKQSLIAISGSTAQQAIYLRDIKGLLIPLCSLSEQQQIVAEIESRLSVCDKLEETIAQSLLQAEALRQSILKQAFAGKLVRQDPGDEPAEKLLARIRAERAAATPVKKPSKGRTAK